MSGDGLLNAELNADDALLNEVELLLSVPVGERGPSNRPLSDAPPTPVTRLGTALLESPQVERGRGRVTAIAVGFTKETMGFGTVCNLLSAA